MNQSNEGELSMRPAPPIQPEYITDPNGKKKAVILPIEEYEELLEDLEDLAVLAERREEPTMSHADLVADLKRNGYLPD
jgi:PHD/YefM family antitoxin component YafN of YafNO toxin-antitoxin module